MTSAGMSTAATCTRAATAAIPAACRMPNCGACCGRCAAGHWRRWRRRAWCPRRGHAAVLCTAAVCRALVAGISAVWALARMSCGGARLRSYVYEETVAKLPLRCLLTGVFAALAAVGECMDVFLNGEQGAIWYAVLFAALAAAAAAAAFAAGHTIRAAVYTEESDSGREE